MLEVFTQRNFVADFIRVTELLVGKPVVDFLFVIIELFNAISYGWDVISVNLWKSAFLKGMGHFERKFQTEGVANQPLLVSEN